LAWFEHSTGVEGYRSIVDDEVDGVGEGMKGNGSDDCVVGSTNLDMGLGVAVDLDGVENGLLIAV